MNQQTSITYSDGVTPNVSNVVYDPDGQRTSMTDGTGTSSWVWQFCLVRTMFEKNDEWGITESYGTSIFAIGGAAGGSVMYQVSSAQHIKDLGGPFDEVAVSGKLGVGLTGDVFWGSARDGTEVFGSDFGASFGPGLVLDVLHTRTVVQQANDWWTKLLLRGIWNSFVPNLPLDAINSVIERARSRRLVC